MSMTSDLSSITNYFYENGAKLMPRTIIYNPDIEHQVIHMTTDEISMELRKALTLVLRPIQYYGYVAKKLRKNTKQCLRKDVLIRTSRSSIINIFEENINTMVFNATYERYLQTLPNDKVSEDALEAIAVAVAEVVFDDIETDAATYQELMEYLETTDALDILEVSEVSEAPDFLEVSEVSEVPEITEVSLAAELGLNLDEELSTHAEEYLEAMLENMEPIPKRNNCFPTSPSPSKSACSLYENWYDELYDKADEKAREAFHNGW